MMNMHVRDGKKLAVVHSFQQVVRARLDSCYGVPRAALVPMFPEPSSLAFLSGCELSNMLPMLSFSKLAIMSFYGLKPKKSKC